MRACVCVWADFFFFFFGGGGGREGETVYSVCVDLLFVNGW